MASAPFYTVEATKIKAGVDARNLGDRASGAATNMGLGVLIDSIAVPAALKATDTITLGRLPKGAVVIPSLCAIHCDKKPAGTSAVIQVGTAADTDEYSGDLTVNAAGVWAFTAATDQSLTLAGTVCDGTAATDIQALLGTITGTVDGTATMTFRIVYAFPK